MSYHAITTSPSTACSSYLFQILFWTSPFFEIHETSVLNPALVSLRSRNWPPAWARNCCWSIHEATADMRCTIIVQSNRELWKRSLLTSSDGDTWLCGKAALTCWSPKLLTKASKLSIISSPQKSTIPVTLRRPFHLRDCTHSHLKHDWSLLNMRGKCCYVIFCFNVELVITYSNIFCGLNYSIQIITTMENQFKSLVVK